MHTNAPSSAKLPFILTLIRKGTQTALHCVAAPLVMVSTSAVSPDASALALASGGLSGSHVHPATPRPTNTIAWLPGNLRISPR